MWYTLHACSHAGMSKCPYEEGTLARENFTVIIPNVSLHCAHGRWACPLNHRQWQRCHRHFPCLPAVLIPPTRTIYRPEPARAAIAMVPVLLTILRHGRKSVQLLIVVDSLEQALLAMCAPQPSFPTVLVGQVQPVRIVLENYSDTYEETIVQVGRSPSGWGLPCMPRSLHEGGKDCTDPKACNPKDGRVCMLCCPPPCNL